MGDAGGDAPDLGVSVLFALGQEEKEPRFACLGSAASVISALLVMGMEPVVKFGIVATLVLRFCGLRMIREPEV